MELLIGAKFYVTFLNLTAVEREFVKRGWKLEKDFKTLAGGGQEGLKESMLNVTKGPFHANIPPAEFMRMQIETLRPKTLIDALEWQFRQGPGADQEYVLAIYEAEARVWN